MINHKSLVLLVLIVKQMLYSASQMLPYKTRKYFYTCSERIYFCKSGLFGSTDDLEHVCCGASRNIVTEVGTVLPFDFAKAEETIRFQKLRPGK